MRALTFSSLGKVVQMRMTTQKGAKKKGKEKRETGNSMWHGNNFSRPCEGFYSAFTYIIYQFRD